MNKRLGAALVFILAIIGGIWFFNELGTSSAQNPAPKAAPTAETGISAGKRIPQFTLTSLGKKEVEVKPNQKPIVLNFFATWCPPCRGEMPELDTFAKKYKSSADFYAVDIQESPDEIAAFMEKNGYSFKEAVLLDQNGDIAKTFRVNALPTTIITDQNGVIILRKTGPITLKELEEVLKNL